MVISFSPVCLRDLWHIIWNMKFLTLWVSCSIQVCYVVRCFRLSPTLWRNMLPQFWGFYPEGVGSRFPQTVDILVWATQDYIPEDIILRVLFSLHSYSFRVEILHWYPRNRPHIFVLVVASTEKVGGACVIQGSLNKPWQLVFGVKNLAAWEMEYIHWNQVASTWKFYH